MSNWYRPQSLLALAASMVGVLSMSACANDAGDGEGSPSTSRSETSTSAAAVAPNSVKIQTFAFLPNPVRVSVGDEVTWTNADDILHTATSGGRGAPDGAFDLPLDGPGSAGSFTFTTAGTYPYHCKIHPGMDATVIVG